MKQHALIAIGMVCNVHYPIILEYIQKSISKLSFLKCYLLLFCFVFHISENPAGYLPFCKISVSYFIFLYSTPCITFRICCLCIFFSPFHFKFQAIHKIQLTLWTGNNKNQYGCWQIASLSLLQFEQFWCWSSAYGYHSHRVWEVCCWSLFSCAHS